ncbi:NADPH-dependent FMN reductase [Ornithinibacillus sp. 179-J 7C1 HS]|uniref:NADPH-dependent FMN reductase n=1 Tax=Ornithinibacillus sp. 179-J 7C1 HS TaxID=3142384 RepID=UPI00399FB6F3
MSEIITISGSTAKLSGSEQVLKYFGTLLNDKQLSVTHISVKDIPYQDLFEMNVNNPKIKQIIALIQNARGVLIGSPVYKGAYSGVLKALIDLLPQDALKHKPILPIMTGGSPSHLLALEYTLKPLLATLKGHNLKGLYLLDEYIDKQKKMPIINEETLQRAKKQLDYFSELVKLT